MQNTPTRAFDATIRAPIQWALLACLVASSAGACVEAPDERFEAQRNLGHRVLIADQLEVTIEPGAAPALDASGTTVLLRASAPTPTIVLTHPSRDALDIQLVIANVLTDAHFLARIEPLASSPSGCEDASFGTTLLSPIAQVESSGTQHILQVTLPLCGRLRIDVVSASDIGYLNGGPMQFAVLGECKGDLDVLADIVERLNTLAASGEFTPDFWVALGNMANSPERLDLETWRDAANLSGLPLVVALGEDEAEAGTALAFYEVFGRSDYTFTVGEVRFLVLDTASAELSETQFGFWEHVLETADEPVRLAFMQHPPIDPAGGRDAGFSNRLVASRLIALLGEHGVGQVFTGGVGTYEETPFGGIPYHSTGGAGGPIESSAGVQHHFLRVTATPTATEGGGTSWAVEVAVEEL